MTLQRELHNLVATEAGAHGLWTQEHLDNIVSLHYGLPMPHKFDNQEDKG